MANPNKLFTSQLIPKKDGSKDLAMQFQNLALEAAFLGVMAPKSEDIQLTVCAQTESKLLLTNLVYLNPVDFETLGLKTHLQLVNAKGPIYPVATDSKIVAGCIGLNQTQCLAAEVHLQQHVSIISVLKPLPVASRLRVEYALVPSLTTDQSGKGINAFSGHVLQVGQRLWSYSANQYFSFRIRDLWIENGKRLVPSATFVGNVTEVDLVPSRALLGLHGADTKDLEFLELLEDQQANAKRRLLYDYVDIRDGLTPVAAAGSGSAATAMESATNAVGSGSGSGSATAAVGAATAMTDESILGTVGSYLG